MALSSGVVHTFRAGYLDPETGQGFPAFRGGGFVAANLGVQPRSLAISFFRISSATGIVYPRPSW
jgi:hypothetical protein